MPVIPGAKAVTPISTQVGQPNIVNSAAIANEGMQQLTGAIGNAMWSVSQTLMDNEAKDYINQTERDYELKRQKTLDSYLSRINDNGRIPETNETLDEAMSNWSQQELEGYEVNAPSMMAYREVKSALAPYHQKTSADSLAIRLRHVRGRQTLKIDNNKVEMGSDIKDYLPSGNKNRLAHTEEKFARAMSENERKVGTIINESQYADYEKAFGNEAVISLMDASVREQEFDQMAQVLGYPYLKSPEAQAFMAKELGLTAAEMKALKQRVDKSRKAKGASGTVTNEAGEKFSTEEISVVGVFDNVTSLTSEAPHYLHGYLSPKEKEFYLREMVKGMKAQKETKDAFLVDRYKNMNVLLQSGKGGARTDAEAKSLIKDIAASDMFEDFQKVNMGATIVSSRLEGQVAEAMKGMDLAQIDHAIKDISNQTKDYGVQLEEWMKEAGIDIKRQASIKPQFLQQQIESVQGSLYAQAGRLRQEQIKDSSEASINYDKKAQFEWNRFAQERTPENYQKFLSASLAYQEKVQIPDTLKRYIPKGYAQEIQGNFEELIASKASSAQLNSYISAIEHQLGPSVFAQRAWDQLAQDKAIPTEVNVARTLPIGAPERGLIFQDAVHMKQIEEASDKSALLKLGEVRQRVEASPTFKRMREILLSGAYPNNMKYITDLQEVLTRRAFVPNYQKGSISSATIENTISDFFTKYNHVSSTSSDNAVAIPIKTLADAYQRRKKNTFNYDPEDIDVPLNLAKNKLLEKIQSDDYEIEIPPKQRQRIYDKLGLNMAPKDDKIVQQTFKQMLKDSDDVRMYGVENTGAFLQYQGVNLVVKNKKGKVDHVYSSWEDIFDDPNTDAELWNKKSTMYNINRFIKKLTPKDYKPEWEK